MVNTSNHVEPSSLAWFCIYQEPSNKPIKLKPAQQTANEAIRIGYNIFTLQKKENKFILFV
jgi:hypothetical protein